MTRRPISNLREWPLVLPNDDGIRPAGASDACFYCHQKVGEPHLRECVIIKKIVLIHVTTSDGASIAEWTLDVPHAWDVETIDYCYNDGHWCADNIFGYEGVNWASTEVRDRLAANREGCLCGKLVFKFARVLDGTPRRATKG